MTVAELGERMSSRELTEWMLYAGMEPFGSDADDARNAISTAATVNAVIGAAGGKKQVKAEQFLLTPPTPVDPDGLSVDALMSKMRGVFGPPPKD